MPTLLERIKTATQILVGREIHATTIPMPPSISMYSYNGIPHTFKPEKSLEMYGENPWLFASVNAIALEASRIPLKLVIEHDDNEIEEIKEHQALDILKNPLPMEIQEGRGFMTGRELTTLLYIYLLLNGENFWVMDGRNAGNNPTRIFPLVPSNVEEFLGKDNLISHYFYRVGMNKIRYEAADVVHFKMANPVNWFRGHSPIKSARWSIDTHREADKHNFYRLLNNAIPGGALSSDQPVPDSERQRLLDQWKHVHEGSRKSNKIAFLPWNLKFTPIQSTNQEMQFAELKDKARDEILANYRVPIEITGKTEDQTRANAEASDYIFMRYTILPLLEIVVDTLTHDYLPMFGGTQEENMKFTFDNPVPADLEVKRQNVETLFRSGAISPNEVRREFGLKDIENEEGNKTYIPFNMMPLGSEQAKEEQFNRIMQQQDDKKLSSKLLDIAKEIAILTGLALPYLIEGFKKGIGLSKIPGFPLKIEDILTPHVMDAIREQSLTFATEAVETTRDLLMEAIKKSVAEGESPNQLAKRIEELYGEKMTNRSKLIARTELTEVINDAQLRTLIAEGYEEKEWFTRIDGRERPSHEAVHGQRVHITQPFQLEGGYAMKPGDSSLPPEERCNCRCDIIGAGVNDSFKKNHFERFIRTHGSLESKFITALNKEFQKQKRRVISKLSSR